MCRGRFLCVGAISLIVCLLLAIGCGKKQDDSTAGVASGLKQARLLVELPDYCNTPDAMALLPDDSFVLSVPNYNDPTPGAVIMKVSAKNEVTKFFVPPPHPDSGRPAPWGSAWPLPATCTMRTISSVPRRPRCPA